MGESSMAMHHLVLVALIFAAACATVRADCDPSDDWVGKTYTGASDIPNPSDPHGDPLGTAQWCLTVTKPPENDKDQYMSLGVDASINDGAKHQCDFTGLPVIISNGDVGTTQCGFFWWKNKQEADNAAASSYTPSLMSNQQHQQQNQAESQENANKGKWGV